MAGLDIEKEMQEISKKISEAISPINIFKAPMIALVLENYVEALKQQEIFLEDAYRFLKQHAGYKTCVFDANDPDEKKRAEALRNNMTGEEKKEVRYFMASYRTCPHCGANLDPDEKCDCQKKEKYMEEKRGFIACLKLCLLRAEVGIFDLKLFDENTVEVTYTNGHTKKINIAMDSKIAIVRDVAKYI